TIGQNKPRLRRPAQIAERRQAVLVQSFNRQAQQCLALASERHRPPGTKIRKATANVHLLARPEKDRNRVARTVVSHRWSFAPWRTWPNRRTAGSPVARPHN